MGGTSGAIITCPLDVLKTRQQSSIASFDLRTVARKKALIPNNVLNLSYSHAALHCEATAVVQQVKPGMLHCLRWGLCFIFVNTLQFLGPILFSCGGNMSYFCTKLKQSVSSDKEITWYSHVCLLFSPRGTYLFYTCKERNLITFNGYEWYILLLNCKKGWVEKLPSICY